MTTPDDEDDGTSVPAPPARNSRTRARPEKPAPKKKAQPKKDLDRETFKAREEETRKALLEAQLALVHTKPKAVLVLVNGMAGSGRGETVNLLGEWMDPRHVRTFAFDSPIEEEKEHPFSFRFFRDLPARGQVGIFFSNYYSELFSAAANGTKVDVDQALSLEALLVENGVHVVKLFFDLGKKAQKKRFLSLESDKKTRWRVTPEDWVENGVHAEVHAGAMKVLRATSTPKAPWQVIDGSMPRSAGIEAGRALTSALLACVSDKAEKKGKLTLPAPLPKRRLAQTPRIEEILHGAPLDEKVYEERLERAQRRLALLTRHKRFARHGVCLVFEGMDAAGKGGAIRRITRALDARIYTVVPIAAPTQEELSYPYLWRFYRQLPRHGRVSIFDRSWYGRVLVERVEGFAGPAEVARAYGEIVRFEDEIRARGVEVVKVWLAIDRDEQRRRFAERQRLEFKRHKITAEDFRNRDKWDLYVEAANDLFERTSTNEAPWHIVTANDKRFARVDVLEHLGNRLASLIE